MREGRGGGRERVNHGSETDIVENTGNTKKGAYNIKMVR